jgi:hypothetical protein
LSGLPESLLLDAAHLVSDKDVRLGQPVVPNGIPLSKIHHAAFDAHLIGIDPDYRLHVSERLLIQKDGPMLEALKRLNGGIIHLPNRDKDRPDRDRLALRFERFKAAAWANPSKVLLPIAEAKKGFALFHSVGMNFGKCSLIVTVVAQGGSRRHRLRKGKGRSSMTIRYHVTVTRQGDEWRAVCPALRHHGAVIGGDTREEALTHIENAILMNGVSPPPNEPVPEGVLLNIPIG